MPQTQPWGSDAPFTPHKRDVPLGKGTFTSPLPPQGGSGCSPAGNTLFSTAEPPAAAGSGQPKSHLSARPRSAAPVPSSYQAQQVPSEPGAQVSGCSPTLKDSSPSEWGSCTLPQPALTHCTPQGLHKHQGVQHWEIFGAPGRTSRMKGVQRSLRRAQHQQPHARAQTCSHPHHP